MDINGSSQGRIATYRLGETYLPRQPTSARLHIIIYKLAFVVVSRVHWGCAHVLLLRTSSGAGYADDGTFCDIFPRGLQHVIDLVWGVCALVGMPTIVTTAKVMVVNIAFPGPSTLTMVHGP